ncbi:MAG: magnesium transporter [Candidatus Woesearchaeota archaeon]
MKTIRHHLEKLRKIRRSKHHPLIHHIHKKYKISKKTLFYVKEYGSHANVTRTILKESWKILILSAIFSLLGGFAIENISVLLASVIPLVIMMPTLNDMIGDYGTIVSARFSTMLHEGKVRKKWWQTNELRTLFSEIFIIAVFLAIVSAVLSIVISVMTGNPVSAAMAYKIIAIIFIDVSFLVILLFLAVIILGSYFYKKHEDPNNFLIPITTSIADVGNLIVLAILVLLFL